MNTCEELNALNKHRKVPSAGVCQPNYTYAYSTSSICCFVIDFLIFFLDLFSKPVLYGLDQELQKDKITVNTQEKVTKNCCDQDGMRKSN